MTGLVARAMEFAERAHAAVINPDGSIGHKRKYSDEPYTVHTKAVAATMAVYGFVDHVVAAAHLHDCVEDCDVTIEQIAKEFGSQVARLVWEVTDVPKAIGNREDRKYFDLMRLGGASPAGQSIKVADLIDNTNSIVEHDKKFAHTYLAEKEAALKVLTRANPALLAIAWDTLRQAQEKLVQDALNPATG